MSIDRNVRTCLHTVHIHILHVLLVFASSISFILFIFNHFNHLLWHRPSAFADVNRSCSLWKSKAQEVEFSLLQADFFCWDILFFGVFKGDVFFVLFFRWLKTTQGLGILVWPDFRGCKRVEFVKLLVVSKANARTCSSVINGQSCHDVEEFDFLQRFLNTCLNHRFKLKRVHHQNSVDFGCWLRFFWLTVVMFS